MRGGILDIGDSGFDGIKLFDFMPVIKFKFYIYFNMIRNEQCINCSFLMC